MKNHQNYIILFSEGTLSWPEQAQVRLKKVGRRKREPPQGTELANKSIWSTVFSVLPAGFCKQPGGHPMDRSGACSGLMNDRFFFPPATGAIHKAHLWMGSGETEAGISPFH